MPPASRCGPTAATAHADFDTRPSSTRLRRATFSQWEKDRGLGKTTSLEAMASDDATKSLANLSDQFSAHLLLSQSLIFFPEAFL